MGGPPYCGGCKNWRLAIVRPVNGGALYLHIQREHSRRLVADVRTLINDRPSGAYLLKTEKAELETGHLATNIRNTRANYARSRTKVEQRLLRRPERRRSWG
jgi:hypothetical protein